MTVPISSQLPGPDAEDANAEDMNAQDGAVAITG